jgi:SAM-dependent MidA family methyltransferase
MSGQMAGFVKQGAVGRLTVGLNFTAEVKQPEFLVDVGIHGRKQRAKNVKREAENAGRTLRSPACGISL